MTGRRGRPPRSAEDTEGSRSRIVAVARRLFAEEGYAGVSMRKIAAQAQCSPAALYTLFPGKRQLLHGLWEDVFADLMTTLEAAAGVTAPEQRVQRLCEVYVDFWLARPDDYRAIFLIEDRVQGAQDAFFVQSSAALQRMGIFQRCLAEAQARGELRAGDPAVFQNVLLCGLQGVTLNLITIPEFGWGDPAALRDATLDALLTGLRAR